MECDELDLPLPFCSFLNCCNTSDNILISQIRFTDHCFQSHCQMFFGFLSFFFANYSFQLTQQLEKLHRPTLNFNLPYQGKLHSHVHVCQEKITLHHVVTIYNYWMRLSMISIIIKAEVCVICQSLWRITQTEPLIIIDIMR